MSLESRLHSKFCNKIDGGGCKNSKNNKRPAGISVYFTYMVLSPCALYPGPGLSHYSRWCSQLPTPGSVLDSTHWGGQGSECLEQGLVGE